MSIFREYDIRGIVGRDLTNEMSRRIGFEFGKMTKERGGSRISVGRDARTSSEDLFKAFTDGVRAAGIEVLGMGMCPTPLVYFSLFNLSVDGGAMITGSHNPGEYNGFKLCIGNESLYGESLQDLRRAVENLRGEDIPSHRASMIDREIIPLYRSYIHKQFSGLKADGLKVILDSGNGMAGLVAPDLFRDLGCEVIDLYSEPDGRFPNHHPDPTVIENLQDLIQKVREEKAAFGVAYDGDADRIGVVDEKGGVIWGDQLMMIFAQEILKTQPGATFVSEVKASQLLFDQIEKWGGRAIMWKTGHSLIKAKLKEEKAVLAGEMSGHIFFADRFFGYDDAVYASLRLLELVVHRQIPVSDLISNLPKTYITPEIRIDCPDDRKFSVVGQLREKLSSIKKSGSKLHGSQLLIRDMITIDGVRAVFEGGWGLVRASNTEPVLVLRFEGDTPVKCNEIRAFMEDQLNSLLLEKQ